MHKENNIVNLPNPIIYRYETYKIGQAIYLDAPVQNLQNPIFKLKNNSLYIFIEENNQTIEFRNLSLEILEHIRNGSAYLREIVSLNLNKKNIHIKISN